MTAHQFIEQLFGRPAFGMPSHQRRITPAQRDLLVELIGQDEEGSAVERGFKRLTWKPSGRWAYILDEDSQARAVLTRLGSLRPSGSGSLF